jgi:hypothetical protein
MVIRMKAQTSSANADSETGHLEAETARGLAERLNAAGQRSTAEMLQELRRAFPHSPLAVRVRALEALRKR